MDGLGPVILLIQYPNELTLEKVADLGHLSAVFGV
jgi:hypothetical protein